MREILFRGKCDGEWVYGSLISHGDYCCILRTPETIGWHTPYLDNKMGTIDGYANPVDPDTVGEYTGLKDKNGTKIFEGDILRGWDSYQDEYCIAGTVMYGEGQFDSDIYKYQGWYLRSGEDRRDDISQEAIGFFEYEVAGNVHDNPELLKSGLTEEGPDR